MLPKRNALSHLCYRFGRNGTVVEPGGRTEMRTLARWCIAHRRMVVIAFLVVLIVANVVGVAAGSDYNSNFKGHSSAGSYLALDLPPMDFPQLTSNSAAIF